MKTTKDVVPGYFDAFVKNNGWENLLTDDLTFNSPTGEVKGIEAFVQMTNQFKQGVVSASVESIITEGDNASHLHVTKWRFRQVANWIWKFRKL